MKKLVYPATQSGWPGHNILSALKLARCDDGSPYYYKVAYDEAVQMLERLNKNGLSLLPSPFLFANYLPTGGKSAEAGAPHSLPKQDFRHCIAR